MLVEAGQHGLRVVSTNKHARQQGVTEGLRFTDAKARCPDLTSQDIDRTADIQVLEKLGHWMMRVAPLVAIDGGDGLMVETTGCAHIYGDEAAMLEKIKVLLRRNHLPNRLGLAGTPGAAYALARTGDKTILQNGEEKAGLADLPIARMRLSEAAEILLRRFGLTRIGQLYDIDRKALARRFQSRSVADAALIRLDQMLGTRHEPLSPLRPPPAHACRVNCPDPILTGEAIEIGLTTLAARLCDELGQLGQGARGFTLLAFRADGTISDTSITLARPGRSAEHVTHLFQEKIDRIDPGYGIDCLVLEAHRVGPMSVSAVALSGDLAASDTDVAAVAALADRIAAKLGNGSVLATRFLESHMPEQAESLDPFEGDLASRAAYQHVIGPRPIRILTIPERVDVLAEVPDGPPQRFIWRKRSRHVARADGPERISPEWWRYIAPLPPAAAPKTADQKWLAPKLDPRADAALIAAVRSELEAAPQGAPVKNLPRARDYYRVEDTEGRRYWIFRKGLYGDNRGGHPDWYVHGLFA